MRTTIENGSKHFDRPLFSSPLHSNDNGWARLVQAVEGGSGSLQRRVSLLFHTSSSSSSSSSIQSSANHRAKATQSKGTERERERYIFISTRIAEKKKKKNKSHQLTVG